MAIALTDTGRALRDRALTINEDMLCALQLETDDFGALKNQLETLIDRVNTPQRSGA